MSGLLWVFLCYAILPPYSMVPVLDGNLEMDAHESGNLGYLTRLRHLFNSRTVIYLICFRKDLFPFKIAQLFGATNYYKTMP